MRPDVSSPERSFDALKTLLVLQAADEPGKLVVKARSAGLKPTTTTIDITNEN